MCHQCRVAPRENSVPGFHRPGVVDVDVKADVVASAVCRKAPGYGDLNGVTFLGLPDCIFNPVSVGAVPTHAGTVPQQEEVTVPILIYFVSLPSSFKKISTPSLRVGTSLSVYGVASET